MGARARLLISVLLFLVLVSAALESKRGLSDGIPSIESQLCYGKEHDGTYFRLLLATPDAVKDINYSLVREYLSSKQTASQTDVEGIMQTVDHIVSCQNEGNFAAVAALFSDHYWVSELKGLPAKADEFVALTEATPSPPAELMEHSASYSDARVLTDGRVAGFLRWDGNRIDDTQLVAFRMGDEFWLIDEVVFVDEPEVFGTPQ